MKERVPGATPCGWSPRTPLQDALLRLGQDVAIKVLPAEVAQDAERLARFEREAKSSSRSCSR